MFNRTTLLIVAIAVAVGLGLITAQRVFAPATADTTRTEAVRLFPQPRAIPAFQLQQSDGTPLVPGELKGHWTLVFIGFTHCPDICPTTLAQLSQAQKAWEALPEATRPRVLFVSVDPDRDSADRVGEYAHAFHRDTLAATGDIPALQAFTRSLSLVFMKMPPDDPERPGIYSVDHSAAIAVLDPEGNMAGVLQPPLDAALIASDLMTLSRQQ
ncbi:MAG: SCO family protein [Pseudoxanthomonas suwonensis]|nr:SCO family protein [Pseudoxanthomonas suwonensis]